MKINHIERNHNPRVGGSSPSSATNKIKGLAERKAKLQIVWLPHGYHKNRFRRLSPSYQSLTIQFSGWPAGSSRYALTLGSHRSMLRLGPVVLVLPRVQLFEPPDFSERGLQQMVDVGSRHFVGVADREHSI